MLSNEEKNRIAISGKLDEFRRFKNNEYKSGRLTKETSRSFYIWLKDGCNDKDLYKCHCMLESRRKKRNRIQSKIFELVESGKALFITLTFKDSVFETTSKETRRRYVRMYLKQYSSVYVANIDYGEDNGREHYHAIVSGLNDIDFKEWTNRYGGINMRHIRTKEQQAEILSRYITKLTYHTIKNSTNNERVIYSRN